MTARMGRPPLPDGEARTRILRVRGTPAQMAELAARAAVAGVAPAELARQLVWPETHPPIEQVLAIVARIRAARLDRVRTDEARAVDDLLSLLSEPGGER